MKYLAKQVGLLALLTAAVFSSALAQSRANQISRPCPGTTTPASVTIDKSGNINFAPCPGATTTGLAAASGSYTKAALPSGVANGTLARVTDSTRGLWRYNGTVWVAENGRRVNALDFCDPATVIDCTSRLQAAIDALQAIGGGTIVFPAGYLFKFASTLDLRGTTGIGFEGTSSVNQTTSAVNLEYTGSGSTRAIDIRSSFGFQIDNLHIRYTAAGFTGYLIEAGHSPAADTQSFNVTNSVIEGTAAADNAAALIYYNLSIIAQFRNVSFQYANIGIQGLPATTGYSNVVEVSNCIFGYTDTAIYNPGNNWNITGNTFEPGTGNDTVAIDSDGTQYLRGVNFSANYIGDATTATRPLARMIRCVGCTIANNWFTMPANSIGLAISGAAGASVTGNRFEVSVNPTTSISLDGSTQTNASVSLVGNSMSGTNGIVETGTNTCIVKEANTLDGFVAANGNSCTAGVPLIYDRTITAGGTTGNRTINKPAGTVNFAAAASAITVTNSFVTTSSIVFPVIRTADTTCTFVKSVVPGAGSFTITLNAGCTAETSVGFMVTN